MGEKTKQNSEIEQESDNVKDQTERVYYYDDSCGYEVFIDDEDEEFAED